MLVGRVPVVHWCHDSIENTGLVTGGGESNNVEETALLVTAMRYKLSLSYHS